MSQAKRKYGLFTGIVLVVGTVIGCGVFIKSGAVMKVTAGSLPLSLVAWLIGGLIMVAGAFCFGVYATRVEKFNGCVDYIEYASNRTIGYYFGYFLGTLCFPIVTSNVAFVGSSYLVACFTNDKNLYDLGSWPVLLIALSLITIFFLLNYFAPKIAHRFQVSILFVKVAPIAIVVVVGLFASLINKDGGIINAFIKPATDVEGITNNFGEAIKITSFAYDGWICVAAFNAEMKDSKKTLPRAIVGGTVAVVVFYLLYFIGASAIATNQVLVETASSELDIFASVAVFQKMIPAMPIVGEIIALLLIFGSCLGSTNVMVTTISRTFIALGVRGEGFIPERMSKARGDDFTITPYLFTYGITMFFAIIWHLANRQDIPFFNYLKDMDTIVCSLVYGGYIIVYVYIIKNFKDETVLKRYIMPIISIAGSLFFIACGTGIYQLIAGQGPESLIKFGCFLALAVVVYIPGLVVFYKNHQNKVPANVI
ncbi:MAG: amino acid permease [Bacilli bacterium]|nr:amino acid permease [Bacilli bacterium]